MLNGKHVTNGVTNGVTGGHAYSNQWEEKLAAAEKARIRKRRQRAKQKLKKLIDHDQGKTIFKVQADGSCINEWPGGHNLYFSAKQWTTYCKLRSVGAIPVVTQMTGSDGTTSLEITVPPLPMDQPDDRWLMWCANDPDRDAVQIIVN